MVSRNWILCWVHQVCMRMVNSVKITHIRAYFMYGQMPMWKIFTIITMVQEWHTEFIEFVWVIFSCWKSELPCCHLYYNLMMILPWRWCFSLSFSIWHLPNTKCCLLVIDCIKMVFGIPSVTGQNGSKVKRTYVRKYLYILW